MKRQARDRKRVAHSAARIMAEQGIWSYEKAKRKAAERLGVFDPGLLPERPEIEEALLEHYRIFREKEHLRLLEAMERAAVSLMERLAPFSPLLGGALAAEVAGRDFAIELYLFAESPDEIALFLEEEGIAYRYGPDRRVLRSPAPTLRFGFEGFEVVALLLSREAKSRLSRQEPLLSLKALRRRLSDRLHSAGSGGGTSRPDRPCRRSSASR